MKEKKSRERKNKRKEEVKEYKINKLFLYIFLNSSFILKLNNFKIR